MDKISKFIQKMSQKEGRRIIALFLQIQERKTQALDVKKLRGYADLYRVRHGDIRIIFKAGDEGNTIISVDFRKDAYRK